MPLDSLDKPLDKPLIPLHSLGKHIVQNKITQNLKVPQCGISYHREVDIEEKVDKSNLMCTQLKDCVMKFNVQKDGILLKFYKSMAMSVVCMELKCET